MTYTLVNFSFVQPVIPMQRAIKVAISDLSISYNVTFPYTSPTSQSGPGFSHLKVTVTGNLIMAGKIPDVTKPLTGLPVSQYSTSGPGLVISLSPTGTPLMANYINGNGYINNIDIFGNELAIAYIKYNDNTPFNVPFTPDALQTSLGNAAYKVLVSKFNVNTGALIYSSLYGSDGPSQPYYGDAPLFNYRSNGDLVMLMAEGVNTAIPLTVDAIVPNANANAGGTTSMAVFSSTNQLKYASGTGMNVYFAKLVNDNLLISGDVDSPNNPIKNPIDPASYQNFGLCIIDNTNKLVMGTNTNFDVSDVVQDAAGNYNIIGNVLNNLWTPALTSDAFLSDFVTGTFSRNIMYLRLSPTGNLIYGTGLAGGAYPSLLQQGSDLYVYGDAAYNNILVTQGEPRTLYDATIGNNGTRLLKITACQTLTNGGTVSPATQTVCQNALVDKLIGTVATGSNPPVYLADGTLVEPSGSPTTTFQWQKSTNGGNSWIDIAGAIQKDYQPKNLTTTTLFHRTATSQGCTTGSSAVVSNNVTVTVTGNVAMNNLKPVYYVCPAQATVIGETGLSGATYTWTPASGLSASNVLNPTFMGSSNQAYVVDITDANGCKTRSDAAVFVVQADAGPATTTACQGQGGVKIGPSVALVGQNVSYSWSPAIGLSCTNCANPVATVASGSQVYTLTVKFTSLDGTTCTTTDNITVSAVAAPAANPAGPDMGVCLFSSPVQLGTPQVAGYTYNWAPGFYLDQQANIAQPNCSLGLALSPVKNPMVYVLTINNNSGGCQFVDTVKVFQVRAQAGDDYCGPRTIGSPAFAPGVLDTYGQPVQYAWTEVSTTGGTSHTLSCTNCAMPTVNPMGTGTVTYRVAVTWEGITCTDDVVVPPCSCPVATITAESASSCPIATATSTVKLSVNVDPTYYNITWSPATALNTTTGKVVESSSTSPIEYTVTATNKVSGAVICSNSIKISQPGVSQPTFIAHDAATCPGVAVNIGEANTVGWSYSWTADNDPNYSSTISNPSVSPTKTTTYTVVVKDDATGCVTKTKAIVTVDPVSEALAGTDADYCEGAKVKLGSPSISGLTYSWSPATGLDNANIAEPTATLTGAGPITYTMTVSNAVTACSKQATVTFTKAAPVLPSIFPTSFCVGKSASIGYSTPLSGVTYAWSPSTNLGCTNCANPVANPAATTTYTVTGTFPGGCITQQTVTVTVNPLPIVTISAGTFDCMNGIVLTASGATGYSWLPTTAMTPSNGLDNPVTVNPSITKTYNVVGTDNNGCVNRTNVIVTPPTSANAGADQTICQKDQTTIGVAGQTGTIAWSVISGDASSILGVTNTSTINVKPNQTTVYQISVTSSGCTKTDQVTVTVNSVSFDLFDAAICQGSSVVFGPVTNSNYLYEYTPTIGLSNAMIAQPTASPTSTTYYKLVVTDKNTGCQLDKSAFVTVNPQPTAILTKTAPTCTGATANNDGKITLTSATNADKCGISTKGAASYDGPLYTTATAYAANKVVQTAIPNTGGSYILRLFNGGDACYRDTTIKVAAVTCAAPVCNITIKPTVSGCYQSGGMSKATVSVEIAWSNPPSGDTMVRVQLGSQTRDIAFAYDVMDPIRDRRLTTKNTNQLQVVAFELPADGSTGTITAFMPSLTSCTATASYTLPPACPVNPCVVGSGKLGGNAFGDYNQDGVKDPGETNGMAGVIVKAYGCDASGNSVLVGTTTTDANGNYFFTGLTDGKPYRVEFSKPNTLTANEFTANGGVGNTTTQFVTAPACGVNIGLSDPLFYCQSNPKIFTPCYVSGDENSTNKDGAVLINFDYTASGLKNPARKTAMATQQQVGTLWGVAYDKLHRQLYSSAMLLRHGALGPLGLGGLYVSDVTTNTTASWLDLTATPFNLDLGQSSVPSNSVRGLDNVFNSDITAFTTASKVGFGDIDISEDGKNLWFINLNKNTLNGLVIDADNILATKPTGGDLSTFTIPTQASCPNSVGTLRPYATKTYKNKVYIGAVCDASATQAATDLRAYVIEFSPSSNIFKTVFDFPLTYPKGYAANFGPFPNYTGWYPWTDNFADFQATSTTTLKSDGSVDYVEMARPTPIFTDIEFDSDGSMVLAFSDRGAQQIGYQNGGAVPADNTTYYDYAAGDVLRAFEQNGVFVLENNAKAGPNTGYGANNSQGPGLGEYYNDNFDKDGNGLHTELVMGGLAIRPGSGEVVVTTVDPLDVPSGSSSAQYLDAGGVRHYNNTTGQVNSAFIIYNGDDVYNPPNAFGKAIGLGGLELGCDLPKNLEIGNYVWEDTNKDGVQDPCEPVLVNVKVSLYKAGIKIAETTTNAKGEYYFSDKNKANVTWTGTGVDTTLTPNMAYKIVFGETQYTGNQLTVNNKIYEITTIDATANNGNDQNDSDISEMTIGGGTYPSINVTTGLSGSVNHTLDAGFKLACILKSIHTTTNVKCNGGTEGTVTLNITGNIGTPTYAWSNGATTKNLSALSAGTYIVTITDGTCSTKDTIKITEPTILNLICTKTNVTLNSGNDGTASVSASGATAPYTYLWSNGATTPSIATLTANTYSVTVTDANGCSKTCSSVVTEPACVLTSSLASTNPKCNGSADGTITLTVSGNVGTPTYLWSNGATTKDLTTLSAATYSVTVTDGACSTIATVTLSEPIILTINCTKTNVTLNSGNNGTASVSASGATAPYTYLWSNGATTATISALTANTYSVTVTDANGCSKTCSSVVNQPSCDLITAELINYIDQKGTVSTSDDEYVILANPTGLGLSTKYNVSGDITKTGIAYGSFVEISRVPISTVSLDLVITDAVSSSCSVSIGGYNLNGNTCLLQANPITTCNNNGTPNLASDDTYSITINPTGNGVSTNYNVSGELTASNLAYGSTQQIATSLPISGGGKIISITDGNYPA